MNLAVVGRSIKLKNLKRGTLVRYKFITDSLNIGKKKYDVYIYYGDNHKVCISEREFYEHFIMINNYFYLKYEYTKKKFVFNKSLLFSISFCLEHLSLKAIVHLYVDIFYYLEQIKIKTPEVLLSFETTIQETFDKLYKASEVLDEKDFIKSVKISNQIFKEMYNLALSLYEEDIPQEITNEKNKYVKAFFRRI